MSLPTHNVKASDVAALSQSIHRLSRRLRKRAQLPLTASQLSALTTVQNHGPLRLGEFARLEQIGKSTMTRLVSKLEDQGYISRRVDPNDGRGFIVALTDHGSDVLQAAASRQHDYLARQLDALEESDRQTLIAAVPTLEKLLAVKA